MCKELYPVTTVVSTSKDHSWEVYTDQSLSPEMFIRLLWVNGLSELSTNYYISSNDQNIARIDLTKSNDVVSLLFELDNSVIGLGAKGYKISSINSSSGISWGNKHEISINTVNVLGQKNKIYDFTLIQLELTRFPANYFAQKGLEINETILVDIHNRLLNESVNACFDIVNNFLVYYVSSLNEA
jgi:hypothetical protein